MAVLDKSSQTYGVSCAIWDHTVLPTTRHKWTHPAVTPVRQAGTRFTYPGGMEGWFDLGNRLHTEMVNPHTDGHPSIQVLIRQRTAGNWSQVRRPNRYTIKPPVSPPVANFLQCICAKNYEIWLVVDKLMQSYIFCPILYICSMHKI